MQDTVTNSAYTILHDGLTSANLIIDTAAISHVISKKKLFSTFDKCKKTVNSGSAKSIDIIGAGTVNLKLARNVNLYTPKNCFYMPEIGINIMRQSEMRVDIISIFTKEKAIIKCQNMVIAQGHKVNNLYYVNVDKIILPEQDIHIQV
ncbi:hypothetical protein GcM1_156010 [Golovinomyces cichoracearum]|uniref:Retrovirus-related Pol polyprotein from transposon TNT 1-94-like beta-barrel domain-containing protein n=1 Tax=Golovinomyces cichoracearum TaxID=62708 RepID=A0A420JA63_9PEZI|nr:hypothetical protein GcM1_156010 [Golovinomyces cichoracearum]